MERIENEPKIVTVRDIQYNKLDETEQGFMEEGATVASIIQNNGKYTVTAHYPARPLVFISASHHDSAWRDKIKAQLEEQGKVECWDDSKIETGSKWVDEIEQVIKKASVAVVLLSPEYINKNITKSGLFGLAQEAEAGRLKLFPIVLYECSWKELPQLREVQIWSMAKPIGNLNTQSVAIEIDKIVKGVTEIALGSIRAGKQEVVKLDDSKAKEETVFRFSKSAEAVLNQAKLLASISPRLPSARTGLDPMARRCRTV